MHGIKSGTYFNLNEIDEISNSFKFLLGAATKVQELERKVQELERKVQEFESKTENTEAKLETPKNEKKLQKL